MMTFTFIFEIIEVGLKVFSSEKYFSKKVNVLNGFENLNLLALGFNRLKFIRYFLDGRKFIL